MEQQHQPRTQVKDDFLLIHRLHGGYTTKRFKSVLEAHAELGKLAGKNDLKLHIHPGSWSEGCYSVAYSGDEPLLTAEAVVRLDIG